MKPFFDAQPPVDYPAPPPPPRMRGLVFFICYGNRKRTIRRYRLDAACHFRTQHLLFVSTGNKKTVKSFSRKSLNGDAIRTRRLRDDVRRRPRPTTGAPKSVRQIRNSAEIAPKRVDGGDGSENLVAIQIPFDREEEGQIESQVPNNLRVHFGAFSEVRETAFPKFRLH